MKKKEQCPYCKSENVASIMYGFPMYDEQMQKDLDSGKITLGGCCIYDDNPDYHCNECGKEWNKKSKPLMESKKT